MFNFISLSFRLITCSVIGVLIASQPAFAVDISASPKLEAIADQLAEEGLYTRKEVENIIAGAEVKQSILDAMKNPAEYKFTWGKYRKLFLQEDRIQQGVDFWLEHEEHFTRAEKEFGVPAQMIAAIIGVESKFGKYKGKHRVLDSLVTLVVGFDRRSKFFAGELKEFLVLCKANDLPVNEILGSYAGAVGFPQFISSSYRAYAVDFSGNGKTDLIDEPIDAIGSVANYFVENGWRSGEPVTSTGVEEVPSAIAELVSRKRKTQHDAKVLRSLGAKINSNVKDGEKLGVLMLNASEVVPEEKKSNTYIVRAGDTACEIAEEHDVSCRSLISQNNLDAKGKIFRGQRLLLPRRKAIERAPLDKASNSKWEVRKGPGSTDDNLQNVDPNIQNRYFYTHENFYVITRYNQSVLYAMAVNDLSQAILKAKNNRSL